ncbi:hypothetical protein V3481_019465 [Fusarium oxysporum f. sp. vasinfectum]
MDIDTEGELMKTDMDMDIPTIVIHPPSDNDGDDDEMKDDLDDTQGICATIEGQLEKEMQGLTVRQL